MLFQDDCGGLEFEDPNCQGTFLPATPNGGALTLSVGDMLQSFSNGMSIPLNYEIGITIKRFWTDTFPSAIHRVTLPDHHASMNGIHDIEIASRYYIPYFFTPDADQIVSRLPSCVNDQNPTEFEPVSFSEYGANISRYQYKRKETSTVQP